MLGRCRGALHKQSARMLAAQDALSTWPDFLTQVALLWLSEFGACHILAVCPVGECVGMRCIIR